MNPLGVRTLNSKNDGTSYFALCVLEWDCLGQRVIDEAITHACVDLKASRKQ